MIGRYLCCWYRKQWSSRRRIEGRETRAWHLLQADLRALRTFQAMTHTHHKPLEIAKDGPTRTVDQYDTK